MKILNEIDCDECEYCVVSAYNNSSLLNTAIKFISIFAWFAVDFITH